MNLDEFAKESKHLLANHKKKLRFLKKNEKTLEKSESEEEIFLHSFFFAHLMQEPALTHKEWEFSDRWIHLGENATLYHGGVAGLQFGDILLPAGITGANPRKMSRLENRNRFRAVYFSTDIERAKSYARRCNPGACYEVRPIGAIEMDSLSLRMLRKAEKYLPRPLCDDDLHHISWCASKATVLRTVEH